MTVVNVGKCPQPLAILPMLSGRQGEESALLHLHGWTDPTWTQQGAQGFGDMLGVSWAALVG